jgi:hypothetical protein
MAAYGGFDYANNFLGMAGLGEPSVRAQPQTAYSLCHRGRAGTDHNSEPGEARAGLFEVIPCEGPDYAQIDHQGVQAHPDKRIRTHRARQLSVVRSDHAKAIHEHLHEARITIDDCDLQAIVRPTAAFR